LTKPSVGINKEGLHQCIEESNVSYFSEYKQYKDTTQW